MTLNPYQEIGPEAMDLSMDTDSRTWDNLRGEAVSHSFHFHDRFNKLHVVSLRQGEQHHLFFPVTGGDLHLYARWIDNPGFALRTGSAAEHRWCNAVFTHKGSYIRAQFTYYKDNRISEYASNWDKFERLLENFKTMCEINPNCEIAIPEEGGDGKGKKPKFPGRGRRRLDIPAEESVVARTAATEYTFMGSSSDSSFYEPLLSKMGLSDSETTVIEFGGSAISDEGFSFFDRFEHVHEVKLNKDDERVIFFPTVGHEQYFYSKDIDGSDTTVITVPCDKLARWVEARFSYANGKVRAELKFYKDSALSSNAIFFPNVEAAVTSLKSDSELAEDSFSMPEAPEKAVEDMCDPPKHASRPIQTGAIVSWVLVAVLAVSLLSCLAYTYKMRMKEESVKLSDADQV